MVRRPRPPPPGPWDSCPLYKHWLGYLDSPPPGLKLATVRDYLSDLRSICADFEGRSLVDVFCLGQEAVAIMLSLSLTRKQASNTLSARLRAMLSAVKHGAGCPDVQQRCTAELVAEWQELYKAIHDQAAAAFEGNRAGSKRQREGFVTWQQLVKVWTALPHGDPARLWLAMSTLIPCQRAGDMGNCRIFYSEPTPEDLRQHAHNLVVLTPTRQYLWMRVFKTAKHYSDGIRIQLPPRLCWEIAKSLQARPRRFLFTQKGSQEPYLLAKSCANWVTMELKRALNNEHATAQLVRRAYITEVHRLLHPLLSSPDPKIRQLAQEKQAAVAHCCAHSITTHRKYRLELDDADAPLMLEIQEQVRPLSVLETQEPICV